jgi:hypothetical protein
MSSSPTVWHNSLAKIRSNLHQESEREAKLCLKTCIKNPSLFSISFFHNLTSLGHAHDNPNRRAYIFAWRGEFVKTARDAPKKILYHTSTIPPPSSSCGSLLWSWRFIQSKNIPAIGDSAWSISLVALADRPQI